MNVDRELVENLFQNAEAKGNIFVFFFVQKGADIVRNIMSGIGNPIFLACLPN